MSVQQGKIKQLLTKREEARLGGGEERIEKQHTKGKHAVHERIAMLLNKDFLEEIDIFVQHRCMSLGMEEKKFLEDGVVVGSGTIDERLVYVFAQDFTVIGGALGEVLTAKVCKVMDLVMTMGAPCTSLNDLGDTRIQEAVGVPCGYSEIFEYSILASGIIPQTSGIFGPYAGGAVYSPTLTDFNIMVRNSSYMFLTGSKVAKTIAGEGVIQEELGGANVHASKSGVAHFAIDNDEAGLQLIRRLPSFLSQDNIEGPPLVACDDLADRCEELLDEIIPDSPNRAYDIYEVVGAIVGHDEFLEVHCGYTRNIIVGFACFNGQSVGIIASQPKVTAGSLDYNSSRKATCFVRFCDSFSILIVAFISVPGSLPGAGQEYNAVVTYGAKLLHAYGETTIPKITVVLRRAYSGAYTMMGSKHLRVDINYAWFSAEIAVMGPSGAVEMVFTKEVKASDDPAETALEKRQEYHDVFANPYNVASYGYVDDVIEPRSTRFHIIRALQQLRTKRQMFPAKRHDSVSP